MLKREFFKICAKVNEIETNVEDIAQICFKMRQRIVTLVEQNWILQAELTETVPRSKYQAMRAFCDEAENKAKAIAASRQFEILVLDQLILSQADMDQLSATKQVRLSESKSGHCWLIV